MKKDFNYQYCPECGSTDFREPYNDGHKQCNDRTCMQEFFDDVEYDLALVLQSKTKQIKALELQIETLVAALKAISRPCPIIEAAEMESDNDFSKEVYWRSTIRRKHIARDTLAVRLGSPATETPSESKNDAAEGTKKN